MRTRGLQLGAEKKFEFLETSLAWSRNKREGSSWVSTMTSRKLKKAFAMYHEIGTNLHLAANCMFSRSDAAESLSGPIWALAMIDESIAATEKTEQRTLGSRGPGEVKGELTLQNAVHSRVFNEGLRPGQSTSRATSSQSNRDKLAARGARVFRTTRDRQPGSAC